MWLKTVLSFSILCFLNLGCNRDNPAWDVGLLVPVAKGSLKLRDLAPDSIYRKDTSGLAHLFFERSLYNLSVDSFFSISDTTVAKSFSIDSLRLYTLNIEYPLTLGAIARQSGPVGALILALHGSTFAIPAIGPLSVPPVVLSADTLFTSMTLDDGKISVSFRNNLPVDITDLRFSLKNEKDGLKLLDGNFPLIRTGTEEIQTFLLAGLTVESKLRVEVSSFSSPGSSGKPVPVDTSNSIVASLKVYDLRPSKATAIWPAQNIIEQYLDFNLRRLAVELKFAKIKSGKIYVKLLSTIDDTLHFYYSLPGAVKNGRGFEIVKSLPPGTAVSPSSIYEEYDFAGFDLDLSGANKDTFNATPNSIIVSIDSTGIQKTISKADNIQVELGFRNLKPVYATGYLGSDTFDFGPDVAELDFLKDLNGVFSFSDVSLSLEVQNKIGADGLLVFNSVRALNSNTGKSISLSSPELNTPLDVLRAKDQNGLPPVVPSSSVLKLDKDNSNINSCVSLLPDQIEYAFRLVTNPSGNVSGFRDFIYDGQLLDVHLGMDVPMLISVEDCSLKDTVEISKAGLNLENAQDGRLILNIENDFPLEAKLSLHFLDATGQPSLDLSVDGVVSAADLASEGRTVSAKSTRIEIPLNPAQVNNFRKAGSLAFKVNFNTRPDGRQVRLYDDYALKLSLSADFNYRID